ncbi:MAG: hypothetical protein IT301_06725 [Dehalococcoidia bacterium]|nr:hypothetical protein [Dehalococcoidia bacterium]
MANFSIPAPVEPEKTPWIHDRSQRPKAPPIDWLALASSWWGIAIGVLGSVGLTAVMFSLRDSWPNHREWLVSFIPFLAIAAIGFGHLFARGRYMALAIPVSGLFLTLIFMFFDLMADSDNAPMDQRDALSILGGICLGITVAVLVLSLLWVEIRNPTKAPAPEI